MEQLHWKTEKIAEVKEDLPEEDVPEHEILIKSYEIL